MDYDLGNVGPANVIEGLGQGLSNAAKNLYTIQQSRLALKQKQQELDTDSTYKHALTDKLEMEGKMTGLEADQMRDYITQQKKVGDSQADMANMTIDHVQDRIQNAARSYHGLLSHALQTPEGQQYLQKRTLGQGALPNQTQDGDPNNPATNPSNGSSVVNSIMPGVGANDEQYNASNPPPMSRVDGSTNGTTAQAPQAGQQLQTVTPDKAQDTSNGLPADQQLPPLSKVYKGLSQAPFGSNPNDLYMKNPNVVEAIKSGNYMVKKDSTMIESANPLSLNENDLTVLNDAGDLKKAGYKPQEIFGQLTPGTQDLINVVGKYQMDPEKLTSSFGGGRQRQELVKAVKQFYPQWSDAVYDQRHKALIDYTDPNGANGKAIVSMRQGVEHMGELVNSIDALSNKTMPGAYGRQIPVLNAPINAIQQYVGGDPDILALKQNINAVAEEMTKSWGGTQAGESRLKNWRDTMSATNSPQGWSGLLSKTAKLWQAAADARESMFGLAMGGQKMQDVLGQGVLEPQQQEILDRVKNGYTPGQSNNNNSSNFSKQDLEAEMRKRGLLK